jgi:hypothetical protein
MYDWITVLQSKAEGVTAYDKYLRDAEAKDADKCIALFKKLRDQDVAALEEIKAHVAFMVDRNWRQTDGRRDAAAPGAEAEFAPEDGTRGADDALDGTTAAGRPNSPFDRAGFQPTH